MSSNRLTAVEALRFLSVFQICLWHMGLPLTAAGFLGVEFFFILGGFLCIKRPLSPIARERLHIVGINCRNSGSKQCLP